MFFRDVRENNFFYQFRYLSRFFIDMKCKQIGFPETKL